MKILPSKKKKEFFQIFFPPLGQTFGVGFLGSLEVYIACTQLSHNINKTSRASFWMLFVIGLINVLFGVIFGRRIRSKRSLLDAGTAYAKKTTHIDDIETGFNFAKKGAKKGKKVHPAPKKFSSSICPSCLPLDSRTIQLNSLFPLLLCCSLSHCRPSKASTPP